MTRLATTTVLLLAAGVLLSGCTPTPDPTPSPRPSASGPTAPSASTTTAPSATATETPEAEPAPAPEPVTCETMLTAEASAALAEAGLELRDDDAAFSPFAEQLAAAGGTACLWRKPRSDVQFTAVQLAIAPAEHDTWARVLAEQGYAQTDDPLPGAFTGPVEPGSGISPVVVVEAARITFVSTPVHAGDLQPAP
jgi:hypothetical protein